ncbi:MAG: hypothetical protein U0984_02710 [Prosthecobacter sp.]|nr:hypothetical protein [Prosthecobacter sp.]
MTPLEFILWCKISITILFWAGPLLLAPGGLLEKLGFPKLAPYVFFRLLGVTFAALVVAYAYGLGPAAAGKPAEATVAIGLVSNGGSCLVLLLYGLRGAWASWGWFARCYMWCSVAATGLITAGLAIWDH